MERTARLRLPLPLTTAALALTLGLTGCAGAGSAEDEAPSSSTAAATASADDQAATAGEDPAPEESPEPLSNARAAAQGEDPAASARAAHREAAESESAAAQLHPVVTLPAALFTEGEDGLTFDAWARTTDSWQADGSDPMMPALGGWDPESEPVVAETVVAPTQDPYGTAGVLTVPVSGPGVTHRIVLLCEHTSPRRDEQTAVVDVVAGETHAVLAYSLGCTPIDVRHTVPAEHIVDGAVRYEFSVAPGEAGRLAVMTGG